MKRQYIRIRPKIHSKMTNKNLIFTMNMEVLMAVLPFNEMIYRDWTESVMKKRKLNYIEWHVIEFGTLEKVHLWYWWLNLSFYFLFLSLSLFRFNFEAIQCFAHERFSLANQWLNNHQYENRLQTNWVRKKPFYLAVSP